METTQVIPAAPAKRRARGDGRVWQMGRTWWVQYYVHGRQVRESSRSKTKAVADRLLTRRLEEAAQGQNPSPKYERVKYEQLRDAMYAHFRLNEQKCLRVGKDGDRYVAGVRKLDTFFRGYRVVDIDTDSIRKFREKRVNQGVSGPTINREVAYLRAMFNLAIVDGKLQDQHKPGHFPMAKESAARKGFIERDQFMKLRDALPATIRPILTTAYWTGMRKGEILGLRWSNVDFLGSAIRLYSDSTKNGEARTIRLTGELLETLTAQYKAGAEFVFTRKGGERIQSFNKAWKAACKAVGLPNLIFHDLRRTGARNLIRAGVSENVAMRITGHKTNSVFKRYDITSEEDLKDAAEKVEKYIGSKTSPEISPNTSERTPTVANGWQH